MKLLSFLWSLFLSFLSLSAQPSGDKTTDGFEVSTVSSFMSVKYKWVKQSPKESGTEKEVNQTPLKKEVPKRSEMEAVRANGESSQFTQDDLALNEVELRKFTVDEFYSPLLRMGEMKDIEILEPESASGLLKEKYFTNFENNILNRWTLPLIGRSQEQLARERYLKEKENALYRKAGRVALLLNQWDPEKAKELQKDLYDVHFQSGWSYPESRIKKQ